MDCKHIYDSAELFPTGLSLSRSLTFVEFRPQPGLVTQKLVEELVVLEDQGRNSHWSQEIYKAHRGAEGYREATEIIQKQVIADYTAKNKPTLSPDALLELLQDAPHLLGRKRGSELSRYISGSYAAFYEDILEVGELVPDSVILQNIGATDNTTISLNSLASSTPHLTVIFAGSSTGPPYRADIPRMIELVKQRADLQFVSILLQEAHSSDIWPIGYDDAPKCTTTVCERQNNAKHLLEKFKELPEHDSHKIHWFIDIPSSDWHDVGGSFNSVFGAWPHKYFVISNKGQLLFRAQFHTGSPGDHYIEFSDLVDFLSKQITTSLGSR